MRPTAKCHNINVVQNHKLGGVCLPLQPHQTTPSPPKPPWRSTQPTITVRWVIKDKECCKHPVIPNAGSQSPTIATTAIPPSVEAVGTLQLWRGKILILTIGLIRDILQITTTTWPPWADRGRSASKHTFNGDNNKESTNATTKNVCQVGYSMLSPTNPTIWKGTQCTRQHVHRILRHIQGTRPFFTRHHGGRPGWRWKLTSSSAFASDTSQTQWSLHHQGSLIWSTRPRISDGANMSSETASTTWAPRSRGTDGKGVLTNRLSHPCQSPQHMEELSVQRHHSGSKK